jgi:hypothetical protein
MTGCAAIYNVISPNVISIQPDVDNAYIGNTSSQGQDRIGNEEVT